MKPGAFSVLKMFQDCQNEGETGELGGGQQGGDKGRTSWGFFTPSINVFFPLNSIYLKLISHLSFLKNFFISSAVTQHQKTSFLQPLAKSSRRTQMTSWSLFVAPSTAHCFKGPSVMVETGQWDRETPQELKESTESD